MRQECSFVTANGLRMHVASAGQGPPVLLLHGFPDTHAVWRKQMAALAAAGFRAIAPDLRGYGKTDAPPGVGDYAMPLLVDDVLALLDALGLDRVRLVGHDWGAAIGWQLCMVAPARLECFVALSVGHPRALGDAGLGQRLRFWYMLVFLIPGLAERALKCGNWYLMRRFTREPTQAGYWRRTMRPAGRLTAALNYYRANAGGRARGRSSGVAVPVMGVWSDGDVALGEKQMRGSGRYVQAEFRYERIEGADHWLQLTAAERVNALLLDYFGARPKPCSAAA